VLLVAIEHGLVQAIYAVVQANVQVEKVGPGGSPDGEADWAWPVARLLNKKRSASVCFIMRHPPILTPTKRSHSITGAPRPSSALRRDPVAAGLSRAW